MNSVDTIASERVAVGGGPGDEVLADEPARAGPVVDDHRHARFSGALTQQPLTACTCEP